MSIPGSAEPLLLSQGGGYQIERSLRFNSSDSAYLSRGFSAGNQKTWTWSGWVKISKVAANIGLFGAGSGAGVPRSGFRIESDSRLTYIGNTSGSSVDVTVTTNRLLRDTAAWFHLVVTLDTTQATASNRLKFYVNGIQETSLYATTYPSLNSDQPINLANEHYIGSIFATNNLDGYLADIHFIDGQALTPSSFAETNATTGQWVPKAYSGSYGTNGFKLSFSNNSSTTTISQDSSGNNNHWTANNISVTAGSGNDSLVDTPTSYGTDTGAGAGGEVRGNYATLNPLDGNPTGLSNGNLDAASANAYPTIFPGSGQWYYEVNGTGYQWDGTRANWTPRAGSHNFGQRAWASAAPSGFKALCTQNMPAPTITKPSTVMDALTWTGTSANQTVSGLNFNPDLIWIKIRSDAKNHAIQDSVRGFTTLSKLSSSGTFAEGDTSNMPDWAGYVNGATSTGFTLTKNGTGADDWVHTNKTGNTYVGWCWDAGSSTVTNTAGTISSQVRANASAGFSIVTYNTSSTANQTIGHGLGVAPSLITAKSRTSSTVSWAVYHSSAGAGYLSLNTTNAFASNVNYWGTGTVINSSVFGVGNVGFWNNAGDMVAYCFAPVAGYSAFGSYTGNGSAGGPMVYTGFRPRWVLIRSTAGARDWIIKDALRAASYNPQDGNLYANQSFAEDTTSSVYIDLLSNGFKLRGTYASVNANAETFIYAAFAESPFQYARAR